MKINELLKQEHDLYREIQAAKRETKDTTQLEKQLVEVQETIRKKTEESIMAKKQKAMEIVQQTTEVPPTAAAPIIEKKKRNNGAEVKDKIMKVLQKKKEPMKPKDIAQLADLETKTTCNFCWYLARDKLIKQDKDGNYFVKAA